ncbi:hypothetical protein G7Y89_g932 [Cudoniella acicularis]|uniref:Zn(2)-C6 fungal-type domain-containing protein n=1 Tax=Cudoniella acicularis TaxID=354080 RepID=A0A8H4RY83_9HELO|nr:hypothetical protein G7Y89_g932 [Cudoniella acicularis]
MTAAPPIRNKTITSSKSKFKTRTGIKVINGPKSKVKTGCRTCKRVKCDEGKPYCLKCTSTSRICNGYGDPQKNNTKRGKGSPLPTPPPTRLPQPNHDGNTETFPASEINFHLQTNYLPPVCLGCNFANCLCGKPGQQQQYSVPIQFDHQRHVFARNLSPSAICSFGLTLDTDSYKRGECKRQGIQTSADSQMFSYFQQYVMPLLFGENSLGWFHNYWPTHPLAILRWFWVVGSYFRRIIFGLSEMESCRTEGYEDWLVATTSLLCLFHQRDRQPLSTQNPYIKYLIRILNSRYLSSIIFYQHSSTQVSTTPPLRFSTQNILSQKMGSLLNVEIHSEIFSFLGGEDLEAMQLTCHYFDYLGPPISIRVHAVNLDSFNRMELISKAPLLANRVLSISYSGCRAQSQQCTWIDGRDDDLLPSATWTTFRDSMPKFRRLQEFGIKMRDSDEDWCTCGFQEDILILQDILLKNKPRLKIFSLTPPYWASLSPPISWLPLFSSLHHLTFTWPIRLEDKQGLQELLKYPQSIKLLCPKVSSQGRSIGGRNLDLITQETLPRLRRLSILGPARSSEQALRHFFREHPKLEFFLLAGLNEKDWGFLPKVWHFGDFFPQPEAKITTISHDSKITISPNAFLRRFIFGTYTPLDSSYPCIAAGVLRLLPGAHYYSELGKRVDPDDEVFWASMMPKSLRIINKAEYSYTIIS